MRRLRSSRIGKRLQAWRRSLQAKYTFKKGKYKRRRY